MWKVTCNKIECSIKAERGKNILGSLSRGLSWFSCVVKYNYTVYQLVYRSQLCVIFFVYKAENISIMNINDRIILSWGYELNFHNFRWLFPVTKRNNLGHLACFFKNNLSCFTLVFTHLCISSRVWIMYYCFFSTHFHDSCGSSTLFTICVINIFA